MEKITGCPILFLHGTLDNVVPGRCSEKLLKVAETYRRRKMKHAERKQARRPGRAHPPAAAEPSNGASQRTFSTSDVATRLANEDGLRCYADGMQVAQTELEGIGLFCQWFDGCSHNDLEKNEKRLFVATISRFLLFCEKTRPL
ncbi:hypothetical protein STCU_06570 [Strigomonas culicis]|nr:hypothetical protein STCU_06570 [Strigomonas culicis]|eukprot:EPY25673.1 hypothetical protein STCU_06570 [Strigomonas culicis]